MEKLTKGKHISRLTWLHFATWLFLAWLSAGCTGLDKLPEGQYLFTGAEITYDSAQLLSDKGRADSQLEGLIRSPNTKILWMRPFLSIHNMVGETKKEKGLKHWLKYKLGSPPVLVDDMMPGRINEAMVNRLVNLGHFDAGSDYEVIRNQKTAMLAFSVSPGKPYHVGAYSFPAGYSPLTARINQTRKGTLIETGMPYQLETLKKERGRIDSYLKNHGYFYFSQDDLLFLADSSAGQRDVDLQLTVKENVPKVARTAFTLERIYVHDDFSLENYHPDTTIINGFYYISDKHFFKPKTILEAVFLENDSLYSRKDHYNTLSYLMGLGVYKFANARFNITDTLDGRMNAGIYLTPEKKMSVTAEIGAAVKTNNYAGPGLNLSFKNRNSFRGAELFALTLGGRFESQFTGQYKGEVSYEVTLDASLTFPRFVPFRFNPELSRRYVPRTVINAGAGLFSRVRYYELQSFNVSLAYNWRSSERISQEFMPVDVSFTNLSGTSDEFREYLDNNPTIRRSFEEQFILGMRYVFTYGNLQQRKRRTNFFISESVDLAGNLASAITSLARGKTPDPDDPQRLLNVPYSQFVKLRNEVRFFVRPGKKDRIGIRLIAGGAIPYGNASTIPYVRQFFVGGTNSVRAFRARTVGPGSYAPSDTVSSVYIDQAGDIKLETSLEYRFPLHSFLKGALFMDAGNIWLVNEDEQRPGGKFSINRFYRELAVGTGLGIRFDFDFVIIRLDLAFPLRKPYLPEGERWVFDEISPGSSSWRRENIILNFAIGYPF